MQLSEVAGPYREALAIHEALRRLGFPSDDIFIQHATNDLHGRDVLHVVLKQKALEFAIPVGVLPVPEALVHDTWQALCESVNSGEVPAADLDALWRSSRANEKFFQLGMALLGKGFESDTLRLVVGAADERVKAGHHLGLECTGCGRVVPVCDASEVPPAFLRDRDVKDLPHEIVVKIHDIISEHEREEPAHLMKLIEFEVEPLAPSSLHLN